MARIQHPFTDFSPGETIKIGNTDYTFVAKNEERSHKILFESGAQAYVAKVQRQDKKFFALKSFKERYRKSEVLERIKLVSSLADTPGMQAARIEVVNPNASQYVETISKYPFLEYAVIMPWLPGWTWSALKYLYKTQYEKYPPPDFSACRTRAINFAKLLSELHQRSVTHCDVCPRNIFINDRNEVALIDFENVYSSILQPPPWNYPAGQDGYTHHSVLSRPTKQWGEYGDLFGGALLIAELLTWYDPEIRELSSDDWYIHQSELHKIDTEPYQALLKSLERISRSCSDLFLQAWTSKTLEGCPSMDAWGTILIHTPETLTIPQKITRPAFELVQKQLKGIKTTSADPILQNTPLQQQAHKSEHVVNRKKIQHRRDLQLDNTTQVSEHVLRRVPPDEAKAVRKLLLENKREVSSQEISPPLAPVIVPLSQQDQSSSDSCTNIVIGSIIVIIITLLIFGLIFLGYVFFN